MGGVVSGIGSIAGPIISGLFQQGPSGSSPAGSAIGGYFTSQGNKPQGQTGPGAFYPQGGQGLAYNYIPTGQAGMDQAFQNLMSYNTGTGQGAQQLANPMLATLLRNIMNDPSMAGYAQAAGQAGQMAGQAGQGAFGTGQGIQSAAGGSLPQLQQLLQQGLNPAGSAGLMPWAQTAGAAAGQAGQQDIGAGTALIQQMMSALPQYQQILQQGTDPRSALYNRTAQQVRDQTGASLAGQGLTGSGVGGAIAGQNAANFNIDWQNQQLQRALSAMQGYGQAMGQAGQTLGAGAGLQQTGVSEETAAGTLPFAAGQALQGARQTAMGDYLNNLGLAGGAGQTGAELQNMGIQQQLAGGQMPWQARQNIFGGQQNALSNFLGGIGASQGLGNQNLAQMLNYMDTGQRANQMAQAQATGGYSNVQDQNAAAAAGLSPLISSGLSGLGTALGGLGGSGGLGSWLQNLFGGGGLGSNQLYTGGYTGGGGLGAGTTPWGADY